MWNLNRYHRKVGKKELRFFFECPYFYFRGESSVPL